MARVRVLVEITRTQPQVFQLYNEAQQSATDAIRQAEGLVNDLSGFGLEVEPVPPVPMLLSSTAEASLVADTLRRFDTVEQAKDMPSGTAVIACEVRGDKIEALKRRDGVKVWPNSEIRLINNPLPTLLDLARSRSGVDCRPFRPPVTLDDIRQLLTVDAVWRDGFRGQNVVVGIVDDGIDGYTYPVIDGYPRPGAAAVGSHGSMCAADVLVAAPAAKLYDYALIGVLNSGGALQMFQSILEHRRLDGTPHVTNSSYGFVEVSSDPDHEVNSIDHPIHRKVCEVAASGATVFFAAGNCGASCPSGHCHASGIGPARSIHASNSLQEVITVAAVNSMHERIGYSSQGPGMFHEKKPDLSSYSHFFGHFGPNRPAGDGGKYDSGTSAASPVAAGVAALLKSAVASATRPQLSGWCHQRRFSGVGRGYRMGRRERWCGVHSAKGVVDVTDSPDV